MAASSNQDEGWGVACWRV